MEWWHMVIGGASLLLGGAGIGQFITVKAQRRKADAEAVQLEAQASVAPGLANISINERQQGLLKQQLDLQEQQFRIQMERERLNSARMEALESEADASRKRETECELRCARFERMIEAMSEVLKKHGIPVNLEREKGIVTVIVAPTLGAGLTLGASWVTMGRVLGWW